MCLCAVCGSISESLALEWRPVRSVSFSGSATATFGEFCNLLSRRKIHCVCACVCACLWRPESNTGSMVIF